MASLSVLLPLAPLHMYVCVCICVRLSTCVCEPDSVMWEEGVSLPYLGKASKPGDEAGVHKVQLITPNTSVQSGNPPPHCLLCTAKGP